MEVDNSSHCLLLPKYKRRKVSAVRDFPRGLKRCSDCVDLLSTTGRACGFEDKNLKETGPRDTLSCYDTQDEEGVLELGLKKQCGVAVGEVIHNNAKGLKRFSEDVDRTTKVDEPCGSKNAEEFKKSTEELDPKVKGGEACGPMNEAFKPIELRAVSIDCEKEVDIEKSVIQLGTKQHCVVIGSKGSMECQNFGTSLNSCNLQGNLHRKFPNRRKVSAVRDFPPALVRIVPLNPRQRNTKISDGTTDNLSAIGHGYKKSENVAECIEIDDENEKDMDVLKTDGSHSIANERKESLINIGKVQLDKVASADHLGMVDHSYSHTVRSSDSANRLEPEYGINNVETGVGNRFLINDESFVDMENRDFHNPIGHDSPSVKDVQESTYQLDAPDDMLSLAPADLAFFSSEDCQNGFLFEDYGEPSESNSQPGWRDGSEEILKTSEVIRTMDDGIRAAAGSCDDEQKLQLNDIRNVASKTKNMFSISGKGKDDISSLFIPQKNPLCKNTHGFSKQRNSSVGGSISKDNATKHRMGEVQVKKVQREVIKLEGGGSRIGKVKYMPQKDACKALEKRNNLLSVKNYKKAPMGRVSENIVGRVVVQGLMAAKRCPWRHSRK